jgi:hypothetical protein
VVGGQLGASHARGRDRLLAAERSAILHALGSADLKARLGSVLACNQVVWATRATGRRQPAASGSSQPRAVAVTTTQPSGSNTARSQSSASALLFISQVLHVWTTNSGRSHQASGYYWWQTTGDATVLLHARASAAGE